MNILIEVKFLCTSQNQYNNMNIRTKHEIIIEFCIINFENQSSYFIQESNY